MNDKQAKRLRQVARKYAIHKGNLSLWKVIYKTWKKAYKEREKQDKTS